MKGSVFSHLVIATAIFSVFLICGVLLVSHLAVMEGVKKTEQETAPEMAERVLQILRMEERALSVFTHDWGVWDDTYWFVQNRNNQFIRSNLPETTFQNSQLNLISFLDLNGSIVYEQGYDYYTSSMIPPPSGYLEVIERYGLLLRATSLESITGIIPLDEGPFLISVQGIFQSDESGPQAGYLIFGRFLSDERVNEISNNSVFPFSISSPYSPDSVEFPYLPYAVLHEKDGTIVTHGIIPDISGEPVYVARTEIPFRSPYSPELIVLLIVTTCVFCLAFLGLLIVYYKWYFLKHLKEIGDLLEGEKCLNQSNETMLDQIPGEFCPIARAADRTISTLRLHQHELAKSQEELAAAEERARILIEQALDAICVINDTKILDCNQVFSSLFEKNRKELIGQDLYAVPSLIDIRYSESYSGFIRTITRTDPGMVTRFEWSFPDGDVTSEDGLVIYDIIVRWVSYHDSMLRFVIARDITQKVMYQKNQEKILERLEENLASMGTLNDEIRNPLTIIASLLEESDCSERERVIHEIERIDKLIDRIDEGFIASEKVWKYLHKRRETFSQETDT